MTIDEISSQYLKVQNEIIKLNKMMSTCPDVDITEDGFGFISEVRCALPILKEGLDEVWPSKYSKKVYYGH